MPDIPVSDGQIDFSVSESAARRISALVDAESNDALMLRVAVSGGGCSGFQYGFSLDETQADDDVVIESGGVRVVVDPMSLDLVRGGRLDYVEDLMGSFFKLENPNAASTCGCGSSFSI